ncbi:MAG TPA: hypothetical protein VIM81_02205 [Gammaproteobacteria bacterium]
MRTPYLMSSGQFRMSVKRCESPFASCALARIVSFGPIWIRVDQLLSRTLGEHERERLHGTQVLKLRDIAQIARIASLSGDQNGRAASSVHATVSN